VSYSSSAVGSVHSSLDIYTSNARLRTRLAVSRRNTVSGLSENWFFTQYHMIPPYDRPLSRIFTPPSHDTPCLDKPVVRFFPTRHLADIQASRQFIFAGLFSKRKRTVVNNLALTAFFHTWYFGNINTRHHNDISNTNSLYTGSLS
jgi:hypothetical protein